MVEYLLRGWRLRLAFKYMGLLTCGDLKGSFATLYRLAGRQWQRPPPPLRPGVSAGALSLGLDLVLRSSSPLGKCSTRTQKEPGRWWKVSWALSFIPIRSNYPWAKSEYNMIMIGVHFWFVVAGSFIPASNLKQSAPFPHCYSSLAQPLISLDLLSSSSLYSLLLFVLSPLSLPISLKLTWWTDSELCWCVFVIFRWLW